MTSLYSESCDKSASFSGSVSSAPSRESLGTSLAIICSECFLFVCFAGDNISDCCSSFPIFLLQVPIWPSVLLPQCYIRGKCCFERRLGQHWRAYTPFNRNHKMEPSHVFRTVCVGHVVQPRFYTSVVAWYCSQCVAMC